MKILASGDHHFDEAKRFAECRRIHAWMAELVRDERPDVFVSGGDIYERTSTPSEREAVAEWLAAIAEVCPVVIAKGNHDRPHDVALMRRIRARYPIVVEERAAVHRVAGAAIATVAWPSAASLLLTAERAGVAAEDLAHEALRSILRGLGQDLAALDGPRLLLGHFMVDGSETSVGQPLVGAELNVGLADLALAGADAAVMGHIHCPQAWDIEGCPAIYTGSPFRTSFGEVEEKSVAILEWTGRSVAVRRVATPATPMMLFEGVWGEGALAITSTVYPHPDRVAGAECRLRYEVASDERDAARAGAAQLRAEMLANGAITVKVEEEVRATVRARAPEVATATNLVDKLQAMWRAKRDIPDPTRAGRLLRLVDQLEEETRESA